MNTKPNWQRVSKRNPCPVCQKPDFCTRAGNFVHCMRVPSNRPQKDGMGWIHRLDESLAIPPMPEKKERPRRSDEELDRCFRRMADKWFDGAGEKRAELAKSLGVALRTMEALRVGWNGATWTIPEYSAKGLTLGIGTRAPDGSKKFVLGGRRGLVFQPESILAQGPMLIVEGPSDVAACLTMGLCVVGRPSNNGGAAILVDLLREYQGPLIVLGENDVKEDGRWPGKEGAEAVRAAMCRRLHRRIEIRYPLDGAKDLRNWLLQWKVDPEKSSACRKLGASFIRRLGVGTRA